MVFVYVTGIMDPGKAIRMRTGLSLVLYGTHTIFHDVVIFFMTFRGLNKVKLIMSYLSYIQKVSPYLVIQFSRSPMPGLRWLICRNKYHYNIN